MQLKWQTKCSRYLRIRTVLLDEQAIQHVALKSMHRYLFLYRHCRLLLRLPSPACLQSPKLLLILEA
jgi:hypothetical protein